MNAIFSQTFSSTVRSLDIKEKAELLWLLLDAARWIKWTSENKKIQTLYNEYILRVSPSNNFQEKEIELHTIYRQEAARLYAIINQDKKVVSKKEYGLIVWLTWEWFSDQEINDFIISVSLWWINEVQQIFRASIVREVQKNGISVT